MVLETVTEFNGILWKPMGLGTQRKPLAKKTHTHRPLNCATNLVPPRFGRLTDQLFHCTGLACNHRANTQRVDFTTSVAFVDVTAPASPRYAEYPVLEAKFPHDFFYPFLLSNSEIVSHKVIMFLVNYFLLTIV